MKPLVSIIIPAYNAAGFVATTLSSVQQQTYTQLEIVVVNDGSTDSTAEIVGQYAQSDPRIKLLSKTNGGVAAARNWGLKHAQGEYVAFLDADDIWHPTKIERQLETLLEATNQTGQGGIYALYRFIDEKNEVLASGTFRTMHGGLATHLISQPVENGSSLMTRRDLALAVGGFDTSYREIGAGGAEDFDFELKLAARVPIYVVSEYLVGYRKYPGNMSSDKLLMARAIEAVIAKNLQLNPYLSEKFGRWAQAKVKYDELRLSLGVRNFSRALSAVPPLFRNDPVRALHVFSLVLPEIAFSWAASRLGFSMLGGKGNYYDLDPKSIGRRPPAYQTRRLIKYCVPLDAGCNRKAGITLAQEAQS
jgi:glycosyltransferase involved in cell wall biosynthesis